MEPFPVFYDFPDVARPKAEQTRKMTAEQEKLLQVKTYRKTQLYRDLKKIGIICFSYEMFLRWMYDNVFPEIGEQERKGWYLMPRDVEKVYVALDIDYRPA